ncbi:MAG: hypothetical protein U1E54_03355 [Candidatus Levybacteria bacterium]|nr:hypothetical protein [Candidatus Levybacteria bacterium]
MKNLLKKIIIWAFKDKIIVLSKSKTVQDVELVLAKYPVYDYLQTGIMKFRQEQDIDRMSRTIIGKIYVLKI